MRMQRPAPGGLDTCTVPSSTRVTSVTTAFQHRDAREMGTSRTLSDAAAGASYAPAASSSTAHGHGHSPGGPGMHGLSHGGYVAAATAISKHAGAWLTPSGGGGDHMEMTSPPSTPWRDVVIHHQQPPPAVATSKASSGAGKATTTMSKRKKNKTEVFMCGEPNCGKQFPRSFALRRHMRIHTGTKPYACDYDGCLQRFNTSGNLSRHKRIHSGERPYPCIFAACGKKFNTSTKLKRHMRIHFPEGQNVFRCINLNCAWSCDNYKEFAAHQKLQHNIIVGAGLDLSPGRSSPNNNTTTNSTSSSHGRSNRNNHDSSSSSSATASVSASASESNGSHHANTFDARTAYDAGHDSAFPSSSSSAASGSFMFGGYGVKQSPPPSSSRKLMGSLGPLYTETGYSSLSSMARDPKKEHDHLYGANDHHHQQQQHQHQQQQQYVPQPLGRRGKAPGAGYALPSSHSNAFPSADTPAVHHFSARTTPLSAMYDTALNSESAYSSHRGGGSLPASFKSAQEPAGHQYEHQSHLHSVPAVHHRILRPPPPASSGTTAGSTSVSSSSTSHHDQDGLKMHSFPVPPPMNPAAPEFTGEELNVVLELMKDSYY